MKICFGRCGLVLFIAVVTSSVLFCGCGQKGDLYLPESKSQSVSMTTQTTTTATTTALIKRH